MSGLRVGSGARGRHDLGLRVSSKNSQMRFLTHGVPLGV